MLKENYQVEGKMRRVGVSCHGQPIESADCYRGRRQSRIRCACRVPVGENENLMV